MGLVPVRLAAFVLTLALELVAAPMAALAQEACSSTLGGTYQHDGVQYGLTKALLPNGANLTQAARAEFGPSASMVDWQNLKNLLKSREDAVAFFNALGLRTQAANGPCDNYLVTFQGQSQIGDGRFFVARHDGIVPQNWAVLDNIADHALDLGRWTWPAQVLVKVPDNSAPGAATVPNDAPAILPESQAPPSKLQDTEDGSTPQAGLAEQAIPGQSHSPIASKPSFDCLRAQTVDEKTICDNSGLMDLDVAISRAYEASVKILGKNQSLLIQRAFMRKRAACLADAKCISALSENVLNDYKMAETNLSGVSLSTTDSQSPAFRPNPLLHHVLEGDCHMGDCSWYSIENAATIAPARDGILMRLELRTWLSHHPDGDYDKRAPRKPFGSFSSYVFCSYVRPAFIDFDSDSKKWTVTFGRIP
jgi:hypothetical protein